jgi:hypothetical protein
LRVSQLFLLIPLTTFLFTGAEEWVNDSSSSSSSSSSSCRSAAALQIVQQAKICYSLANVE